MCAVCWIICVFLVITDCSLSWILELPNLPVAPVGDANGLDDEDHHLAEEDEEEEEEADGAVGPETGSGALYYIIYSLLQRFK